MSQIKLYLLLTSIYIFIAIIFTWPMPLHPNSVIFGYPGDSFGTVWRIRLYKDSRQTGITDFSYYPNLAAPFGTYYPEQKEQAIPIIFFGILKLASYLPNEVFAYNFILFLSFVLTPLFTFFLLKYLTKNNLASFIGSLIFNLAPYHFWHSFNHLDLAEIQWIPLYVLALLNLEKKRNIWSAFLAAAAYLLVIYTSFYYGYFMFLFTIVFLIFKVSFDLISQRKAWFSLQNLKQYLISYSIFGLLIFIFLFPLIKIALFSDLFKQVFTLTAAERTIAGLVGLSARPWDYFLPSINHPIWGGCSQQFYNYLENNLGKVKSSSAFVQERTIYLGIINLILALGGIFYWLKSKKFQKKLGNDNFPLTFFLTAIALVIISGPPFVRIFGFNINLPSYYLFTLLKTSQAFRVYARLGVVVLLCVTILASYGAKYIFEILKGKFLLPTSCFLLLTFLIIFDFLNFPPFNVTDVSKIPQCYQWLTEQPDDFIFLEYPDLYAYTDALLFQRIHQKKLFNIMGGQFHDLIWPLVNDLDNPEDIDHLKAFGVKYIFLHTKNVFLPDELDHIRYLRIAKALEPEAMRLNLEVAKQCPEGVIYQIRDFLPEDKIFVIREDSEKWYPAGDWELKSQINHLFLVNATAETKIQRLNFEGNTQALEVRIDNSGNITEISGNIVEVPPGLTRVVIINRGKRENIVLRNL